jgi:hypothetical protein
MSSVGISQLSQSIHLNGTILSIDLRDNPDFKSDTCDIQVMKYTFIRNVKTALQSYLKRGARIKLEWLAPKAFGLN